MCEQFQVVSLSECTTQKVLEDGPGDNFHHFKPTSTAATRGSWGHLRSHVSAVSIIFRRHVVVRHPSYEIRGIRIKFTLSNQNRKRKSIITF